MQKLEDSVQHHLASFNQACVKNHEDFNKNLPKDRVYHYTNYQGLKGIIESRRLWYTDCRYLNDPTELKYWHQVIVDALFNMGARSNDPLTRVVRRFINEIDNLMKVYICCFSERIELGPFQ